jgi:hypothetical protein
MLPYSSNPFQGDEPAQVAIDIYTSAYRISGTTSTRFTRIADLLNQVASDHLMVDRATVSTYDDPTGTQGAPQLFVALDAILFASAALSGEARPEMRIVKRSVRVQLGGPPFRLTGLIHVPTGGRPADGLLNATERFLVMTEVQVNAAAHPELDRRLPAIAVARNRVHLFLVADDAPADEMLASVLDEQTAEAWLSPTPPQEPS